MRKILSHTLGSALITSIVLTIFLLPGSEGLILIPFFIILSCAFFPAFLAALIYEFANRKLSPGNSVYAALLGTSLLLITYHLFLAAYIVFVDHEPWYYLIYTIRKGYFFEFAIPNTAAIVLIISIPLMDIVIKKLQRYLEQQQ